MIHKENEEDILPVVLGGWQHVLFLRYLEKKKSRRKGAVDEEEAPLGKQILTQLQENLKIAGEDMIPICQGRKFILRAAA